MHAARSVFIQLSGLAGILTFLTQMWNGAALEQSLYTGLVTGGGVYMILLLTDMFLQRIVAAYTESLRKQAKAEREAIESSEQAEADSGTPTTDDTNDSKRTSKSAAATDSSEENTPAGQEMAAV